MLDYIAKNIIGSLVPAHMLLPEFSCVSAKGQNLPIYCEKMSVFSLLLQVQYSLL